MAEVVYVLCTLTSAVCALLLFRGWRSSRNRLLFWSSLCFVGFAINNAILFFDMVVIHWVDLSVIRLIPALAGVMALLYGLIQETP
jgi:hypothetical protein